MYDLKYLHIMPDSIYSKDYMDRINKLYNSNDHYFVITQWDGERGYFLKNGLLMNRISNNTMITIVKLMIYAEQVILHSLFIDKKMHVVIAILSCIMPRKFSWYVWSADLYKEHKAELQIRGIALSKRIKRWCRTRIIRHLHKIIVVADEDYTYAKQTYGTRALMVQAEYAYNLIDMKTEEKAKDIITILAGHNASSSLLHKEMYDRLSFLAKEPVEILSMLSYPDMGDYTEKVIKCGYKIFGNKYHPITEWVPYEKYIQMLNQIDVALFEGDCMNGAGNIFNLIYLGTKVYLSEKNSIYHQLKREGIICYSKEKLQQNIFEELSEEEKQTNKKKIEKILSDEVFIEKWNKVFG